MSWGEVKKIAEKIDNMETYSTSIYVNSGTFTVPADGRYRIIAIGAGGTGGSASYSYGNGSGGAGGGGGAGGVGVLIMSLSKGQSVTITVDGNASFGSYVTATKGNNGKAGTDAGSGVNGAGGEGGSASGDGVTVYKGTNGVAGKTDSSWPSTYYIGGAGGSVAYSPVVTFGSQPASIKGGAGGNGIYGADGDSGKRGAGATTDLSSISEHFHIYYGRGGGSYGGGGGGGGTYKSSDSVSTIGGTGGAAAVIIQYLGF